MQCSFSILRTPDNGIARVARAGWVGWPAVTSTWVFAIQGLAATVPWINGHAVVPTSLSADIVVVVAFEALEAELSPGALIVSEDIALPIVSGIDLSRAPWVQPSAVSGIAPTWIGVGKDLDGVTTVILDRECSGAGEGDDDS